ncbi:transposase [Rubritalea tangerina]|uniref:Transposase n=1 Tax=Rubritalea tangerina TaxID=430798 RepID=A0ABW4Z6G6_9BACT
MSKARLLAPWVDDGSDRSAIYHVVSRIVGRDFLLDARCKEQFVRYMRMYEAFCGVRVLTYCIMTNHFHILVEIPPKCDRHLSDEALIEHLEVLYSEEYVDQVRLHLELLEKATHPEGRAAHTELREHFTRRMWDLGLFMKTLKQRFSTWYNKKHGRRGTLWEARYKSVLVENGYAARTMAAYIELNPVRAGMVEDPKAYRWCGYAEAVAGGQLARNGLMRILSELDSDTAVDGWSGARDITKYDWRTVAQRYRLILFEDGASYDERAEIAQQQSRGFSEVQWKKEQEREGKLSIAEIARCQSRYFVEGAVLGSREWVNEVIEGIKGDFLSESRKALSSKMRGALDGCGLWSMRKLE